MIIIQLKVISSKMFQSITYFKQLLKINLTNSTVLVKAFFVVVVDFFFRYMDLPKNKKLFG